MALILNIETATTNCSVSLSLDGKVLLLKEKNSSSYSHAEVLHIFIKDVIEKSSYSFSDLDAIAVSKGPGSYTGLRIGVSAAKGLCFSLDIPLISVDTLGLLANQVQDKSGLIIPLLDARRMEVYSAVYSSNLEILRQVKAEVISDKSYTEYLNSSKVYFLGNAVEKTKAFVRHPNAFFIEDRWPSAAQMGELAEAKYNKGDTENVAYFEPFYLKDFIALKKQT